MCRPSLTSYSFPKRPHRQSSRIGVNIYPSTVRTRQPHHHDQTSPHDVYTPLHSRTPHSPTPSAASPTKPPSPTPTPPTTRAQPTASGKSPANSARLSIAGTSRSQMLALRFVLLCGVTCARDYPPCVIGALVRRFIGWRMGFGAWADEWLAGEWQGRAELGWVGSGGWEEGVVVVVVV